MDLIAEIDRHRYLYLAFIGEPTDNQLRLVVQEARAEGPVEDLVVGDITVPGIRSIVSTDGCAEYEIVFRSYIAYSVRNESFTTIDADEMHSGRRFCVYRASTFLDYVQASTFASVEYPGPFTHYGLNCLNHIVDVASCQGPEIVRSRGAG